MKHQIALILFLVFSFSYSQNFQISKVVVDADTKRPLENVLILNERDNSTTNSDGKFIFISPINKINISLLGYDSIVTNFDKLKNTSDTIFMQIKATNLEEVVVTNSFSFMKKVYEKTAENGFKDYSIDFFLRNTLKKDNQLVVLQDIYARKNRNRERKKMTTLEILNMRKVSLFEKNDRVNFEFPNFKNFAAFYYPSLEKTNFTEIAFNDPDFKKIEFESNEKDKNGQIQKGYFIINRADYAIVEYSIIQISNPDIISFQESLIPNVQYKSILKNKFVKLTKDVTTNKYYPITLKVQEKLEVLYDEKTLYYDFNMDYFATNNPIKEKIKPNFSADKDIFKADFTYSKEFWSKQNQLPLTKELEHFLKSVEEKKDKTKEYRIIGNF